MKLIIRIICIWFIVLGSEISLAQTTPKGDASYYSNSLHGNNTASGVPYDKNKFTAAHRTLPFNTKVRVTNLSNNKSVIVIINDRGPYDKSRIIDLSEASAKEIELIDDGVSKVKLEILNNHFTR